MPGLAFAAARDAYQLRRDPEHSLAGGDQGLLKVVGEVTAVLYRPYQFVAERSCPAQRVEMALLLRRHLPLAE